MSNKNNLVSLDINHMATHTFKYDLKTFITQLTNTKQVVFKIIDKQDIFNKSRRLVAN